MRVSTSDSLALFTSPLCVFTKFDAPHLLKVSRLGILGQTGGRSRFETFFGGAGSVLAGGRLGHLLGGVRSERKRPALGRRRNHICSRHKPQEACWTVWLLGAVALLTVLWIGTLSEAPPSSRLHSQLTHARPAPIVPGWLDFPAL